jgi:hypothetical protein
MTTHAVAHSVHQRLLNIRDKTDESFNHLLMRYGLERLLYRLQACGHADDFVLKGAMLFALWQDLPGRPTRDIDLLGFGTLNHERLRHVFEEACHAEVADDGLHFDAATIRTDDIRDDQEYHGIRVRLLAFLAKARLPIQIDIGFGDAIYPPPEFIDYPSLLDFPAPHLRAYHPATVIAEKLNATVTLGIMNSRVKDFYDMYMILTHMSVDDATITQAIRATFARRKCEIPQNLPVAFTPAFTEDGTKMKQWDAFLKRSELTETVPDLQQVLRTLHQRLVPLMHRAAKS